LKDDKLISRTLQSLAVRPGDTENCVAHNGRDVPVPVRYIEVQPTMAVNLHVAL